MISVRQADSFIQQHLYLQQNTTIPLRKATSEVFRQNLLARDPIPSFDRVMMDGIALKYAQVQNGRITFPIQSVQRAGKAPQRLKNETACIEVMTGSPLPAYCDCVIPYEELERQTSSIKLLAPQAITPHQHIHKQGSDAKKGQKLLSKMTRLQPVHLGILASQGCHTVDVAQRPRIAVITTGDELVGAKQRKPGHKIYASNDASLISALNQSGFTDVSKKHVQDNPEKIFNILADTIDKYNVIIISGGVSKGRYDFIPDALKQLRVKKVFHRVKQKPGNPLWFGRKNKKTVFGLPGNPVSVLVCFYRYVLPFLNQSLGLPAQKPLMVKLSKDISFPAPLTLFQPVEIKQHKKNGLIMAKPVNINCSGDFVHLNTAHGFIALPAAKNIFKKGECYPFTNWNFPA
ncbi:MAG: molybdopterin molybdotransferase MoeA [Candidatus Omnitrophica bacterium]|nr:molybdopterin molybdotransferase MoeA [Candidatus Omnitrophota bacterium]